MEKLEVDVVVMGSGGAGLGAAIAAAEGGAKVVLFEKRKMIGGISVTGLGLFAIESRLQNLKNVPYTKDDVFNIFMDRTHWKADAMLVRAFIDKTASTIEWLEGMGVEFGLSDCLPFPGALNQTGHLVMTPGEGLRLLGGVTFHMIKAMKDRAEKLGVDVRLDTTVKKIVQDGGRITKVLAQSPKDSIEVSAKAIVIAAGGYVHNKEMMKKYGDFEVGYDFHLRSNIPLTGEGIEMAWELGAVHDGIFPYLVSPTMGGPKKRDSTEGHYVGLSLILDLLLAGTTPALWVNKDGMRFVNEGLYNMPYMANAVVRQKDKCCFNIVDSDIIKHLEQDGLDHRLEVESLPLKLSDFNDAMKKAREEGRNDVFEADSIPELAAKIGVNPDTLQKTVNDYNECCDKGHDSCMAKNPVYLRPIRKAKFYAFLMSVSGLGTLGGIKINYKAEAINKNGNPVPGLYAAGDCANGPIAHCVSLAHLLWGSTLSFAVNSGRIAGESAAEYIKSL